VRRGGYLAVEYSTIGNQSDWLQEHRLKHVIARSAAELRTTSACSACAMIQSTALAQSVHAAWHLSRPTTPQPYVPILALKLVADVKPMSVPDRLCYDAILHTQPKDKSFSDSKVHTMCHIRLQLTRHH
jgi:hypothetical protein